MYFFGTLLLLIIIALVSLAWGSNDPANKIISAWKFKEVITDGKPNSAMTQKIRGGTIDFLSDKTFLLQYNGGNANGPWVILKDGRIKMTIKYGIVEFGLIKDNELIVKHSDGDWGFQK